MWSFSQRIWPRPCSPWPWSPLTITCLHVYLGDGEKLEPLHVGGGQVGQQLGAQAQHPIQLSHHHYHHHHYNHHHYHHYHHHLSSFSWVQRRQPRMSWAETRSGMAEWAAQIALHNKWRIMLTRYFPISALFCLFYWYQTIKLRWRRNVTNNTRHNFIQCESHLLTVLLVSSSGSGRLQT